MILMKGQLKIYNTITKEKEIFTPITEGKVGMYVCGPTVYNDVHIGNCRTFMSFDVVYRYLTYLGYDVRYVRNITDVGHLENDSDEGEDKISKKAKLEQLEPMEIVQKYTNGFHHILKLFNNVEPSIEPTATGHIIEQIEMVQQIIDNGWAYESEGSVYFDVEKFANSHNYGKLSRRRIEDLYNATRDLDGQSEKRNPLDFAIWKNANPEHLMQWNSPWGKGFPGWHLECSVMSTKYLGETFDIHGGGMDLKFPHHECEIAQNVGATGNEPAKYWMHANMLTVNGSKMSKSLNNSFLPEELFSGNHDVLDKGYSPMTVRFFMLQTHYRSTLDFSNQAIQASEKGFQRLCDAISALNEITPTEEGSTDVKKLWDDCFKAINDDFNTPILIAKLFDAVKLVNNIIAGKATINSANLESLKKLFNDFVLDVLGLKTEQDKDDKVGLEDDLMKLIIELRKNAKANKNYAQADQIRDALNDINIEIKDTPDGAVWNKK